MLNYSHSDQFSYKFKAARRAASISQESLAAMIGVSRDLIVRIEKGENVGIHPILAALEAIGSNLFISSGAQNSTNIVNGNFDDFYQTNFRDKLLADLEVGGIVDNGFLKPEDSKRMKVKNWKKSVAI